jgi:hypothetical protein
MDATLRLASDDGIKAWLNGAVVHANASIAAPGRTRTWSRCG